MHSRLLARNDNPSLSLSRPAVVGFLTLVAAVWMSVTASAQDDDRQHETEARAALDLATAELSAIGHGVEGLTLAPEPDYPRMFSRLWQAAAAQISNRTSLKRLPRNLIPDSSRISRRRAGSADRCCR